MITKEEIGKIFARQLAKIQDEGLRFKVVEAWVEGCKRGGWETVEALRKMPFTLLTDTRGLSFLEHTMAVTEGAWGLAKAQTECYKEMPYEVNFDRLMAGGLLHDIGKLLEIQQDGQGGFVKGRGGMCTRHPISGSILAAELGFSPEIINTIACHAKEGEGRPQVIETVFIHQADFATFTPLVMMKKDNLIQ
jgi:putative nucleotidyltransferase with HDIG domain